MTVKDYLRQLKPRKYKPSKQDRKLVDEGIDIIRSTWGRIHYRQFCGSYAMGSFLQDIYTVYMGWRKGLTINGTHAELMRRLADETISVDTHLLELLIRVALPEIEINEVRTWVDAIRRGEAHHVQTANLRGFVYVSGGLVRCAKLFRKEQKKAEADRLEAEEDIKYARRERFWAKRLEKQRRSIPEGKWGLYR